MDRMEELKALAWEAYLRGSTYGKLVSSLRAGEPEEIVKRYRRRTVVGTGKEKNAASGRHN